MPEPIQPVVTPPATPTPEATPTPPAETPEAQAEAAEAKEWDEVAKDLFPNLTKPEEKKEENNSEEKNGTPAAPEKKEGETAGSEENKEGEPPVPQPSPVAQQRETQRQMAQEFDTVKKDVALTLFKDLPMFLKDADGDPIRGIEDVMKLVDPRTKEPFTEESATAWLTFHQNELNKSIDAADKEADRITSVNLTIKDEADKLRADFADVLKANPDVMKSILAEYGKSLEMTPDGKIILKAPISLYSFASTALKPYAESAKATAEAEAAKKAAEEVQRKQNQSSRSDVFGGAKTDTSSEEDKEWDEAARNYYGPQFQK